MTKSACLPARTPALPPPIPSSKTTQSRARKPGIKAGAGQEALPDTAPINSRVRAFREAFGAVGVMQSILLASTFRSGSTYVAELLRHNGIVGLSIEKFNTIWKTSAGSDAAFRKAIDDILCTSDAGVFAAKIMWTHRTDLARCLRLERGQSTVLAESFPDPRWIWVKRRDKVRQAISFWRARQSGRWHVFDGSTEPAIAYDFNEIRECYREMLLHDVCWGDFFTQTGIAPLVVEYEDLKDDLPAQVAAMRTFAGRPAGGQIVTQVRLKQQSDTLTEEIYHRFMDDCHRYG